VTDSLAVAEGDAVTQRKDAHLDLCLNEDVGSKVAHGFDRYTLEYDALPEIDLSEVDLSVTLLGKTLRAPILVGAMTGGTERARLLNERLARAAARVGVGMCLGSQRAAIERPELAKTYSVREVAPELPLLIGNVGAVQLNYGVEAVDIANAIEAVQADALYFHLNPLQEAVQPKGDTNFAGLAARLAEVIPALPVPCLAKEVGHGISPRTARKLAALPLAGIEVAGVGGTSWARVESYRAAGTPAADIGRRLAGFGVPVADSIVACREALGDERLVIGSGGVRTGMHAAIAIALGADAVALARPLLVAAEESEDAVVAALETIIQELKTVCFCTGARGVKDLRTVRVGGR
jgi:isopentenyl-diphosphate delta-isomerase